MRQALVEGGVIAVLGTGLGLVFASWSSRALVNVVLVDHSPTAALAVGVDSRVLAFTCTVAIAITLVFSTGPLWILVRRGLNRSVPVSARIVRGIPKTGQIVVVVQTTLSIVLLMEAGLLVRTVRRLAAVPLGYQNGNVFVANLSPLAKGYASIDGSRYYFDLLNRIDALPGVQAASLSQFAPGDRSGERKEAVADATTPQRGAEARAIVSLVSADFFRSLSLPLLQGRSLSSLDNKDAPRVAVVSRSLANRLFPGTSVIGRHIRISQRVDRQRVEIVGVVADARLYDARDPDCAVVYLPHLQAGEEGFYNVLLIKTEAGVAPRTDAIIRAVASFGVDDVTSFRSLEEMRTNAMVEETITAAVAASFGLLALGLAAVGVYNVTSFVVNSRKAEIAVRAAMGATRIALLGTAMGGILRLLIIGMALGVPASLIASRFTATLLFEVQPDDLSTLLVTAMTLFIIGACAAFLPARSVCDASPSEALRI